MIKVSDILREYTVDYMHPKRFKMINDLTAQEEKDYAQIHNSRKNFKLREKLKELIDKDIKDEFLFYVNQWEKYGLSVSENDKASYSQFKTFYDEIMSAYGVKKDAYVKVDFAVSGIRHKITDIRCLNAKLSALQIFKAAYQLGDLPAVANFRFMHNPPDKCDGKYREWLLHFDNSNYAAELKLITTRLADTIYANKEQCLAAFIFDMNKTIRYTECEAATKFSTMEEIERELAGVPDSAYAVLQGDTESICMEAGLRTEMIVHHRSSPGRGDTGQGRDSELMTFHGVTRCKEFLSKEERADAHHLTKLQNYVLGGFKESGEEYFLDLFEEEREVLNQEIHALLVNNKIKNINIFKVAEYDDNATRIKNEKLYKKQKDAYDSMIDTLDTLPKLKSGCVTRDELNKVIVGLMNYDQNLAFNPACTENAMLQARTDIRERTSEKFINAMEKDVYNIRFSQENDLLLPLKAITDIAFTISEFYLSILDNPHSPLRTLYCSRAALAKDYVEQLVTRVYSPEAHQTIVLFIYYMLNDICDLFEHRMSNFDNASEVYFIENRKKVLQHFVSYRMIQDNK